MTTEDADEIFLSQAPRFLRSMLPAHTRLAALLATERLKGEGSKWSPYVRSLPATPPNAWFYQSSSELDARLDSLDLGLAREKWQKSIKAAHLSMERLSLQCVKALKEGSGIDLTERELMWALGQVLSRAFGSGNALGLAPVIDLPNHKQGAIKPFPMELDGQTFVCVTSSSCSSSNDESLVELCKGEELYISYVKSRPEDKLETFLNFGFIC